MDSVKSSSFKSKYYEDDDGDFKRDFTALVGESLKRRAQAIETMCEKSLLDEKKRGVLVIEDRVNLTTELCLSETVPFGEIHYIPKDVFDAGTLPPPAEGGGRT